MRLWSSERPYLYTLVLRKGDDIRAKKYVFPVERTAWTLRLEPVSRDGTSATVARRPSHATLIAHRGESHDAPENTLPAHRMTIDDLESPTSTTTSLRLSTVDFAIILA